MSLAPPPPDGKQGKPAMVTISREEYKRLRDVEEAWKRVVLRFPWIAQSEHRGEN